MGLNSLNKTLGIVVSLCLLSNNCAQDINQAKSNYELKQLQTDLIGMNHLLNVIKNYNIDIDSTQHLYSLKTADKKVPVSKQQKVFFSSDSSFIVVGFENELFRNVGNILVLSTDEKNLLIYSGLFRELEVWKWGGYIILKNNEFGDSPKAIFENYFLIDNNDFSKYSKLKILVKNSIPFSYSKISSKSKLLINKDYTLKISLEMSIFDDKKINERACYFKIEDGKFAASEKELFWEGEKIWVVENK